MTYYQFWANTKSRRKFNTVPARDLNQGSIHFTQQNECTRRTQPFGAFTILEMWGAWLCKGAPQVLDLFQILQIPDIEMPRTPCVDNAEIRIAGFSMLYKTIRSKLIKSTVSPKDRPSSYQHQRVLCSHPWGRHWDNWLVREIEELLYFDQLHRIALFIQFITIGL